MTLTKRKVDAIAPFNKDGLTKQCYLKTARLHAYLGHDETSYQSRSPLVQNDGFDAALFG